VAVVIDVGGSVVIDVDGDVVGTVLKRHHHGGGAIRQGVVDQIVEAAL
jgi:hypothetical protein